jgi:hypothetical protein
MNETRHFYLYAKHWYEKSDSWIDDLRKITAHIVGLPVEMITEQDVYRVLLPVVWTEIQRTGNPEHTFVTFALRCQDETMRGFGIIPQCMSILSLSKTADSCLPPDENVLPLARNALREPGLLRFRTNLHTGTILSDAQ